jgi:hypothetical protein
MLESINMAILMPYRDSQVIGRFVDSQPQATPDKNGKSLALYIVIRTHNEWLHSEKEQNENKDEVYGGQGFTRWVSDEAHYALERQGAKYNPSTGQFNVDAEITRATREKVLEAVAQRSIEYFNFFNANEEEILNICFNKYRYPLRVSLEKYLV